MNVACYGWLAFSSVNETFVSRDWDFDVTLCETAPVLLNERDDCGADDFRCFRPYVEVLA